MYVVGVDALEGKQSQIVEWHSLPTVMGNSHGLQSL
jgi:hypothetical protein